jgi:hypothetical protein
MNPPANNNHPPRGGHHNSAGGGGGSIDPAVAGLAREVDALRREVRAGAELPEQVADLANTVSALADEIAAHAGRAGKTAPPLSWLDLHASHTDAADDQHTAEDRATGGEDEPGERDLVDVEQVLAGLVSWVGRIFLRYPDAAAKLPECWCWHPEILEELLWLAAAWYAAYGPGGSVALVGDWHDRYRPGVTRRIGGYAGDCSLSAHLTRDIHPADDGAGDAGVAGGAVTDQGDIAQIAAWWAAGMPGTGPNPTLSQLDAAAARWRQQPRGGGRR